MSWRGAGLWLALTACASHPQGTQAPPSPWFTERPGPEEAAAVTGVAAVAYAVGGGCKIAGCPTDLACNPTSERCERFSCREGSAVCPPGSLCHQPSGTCRTLPPPGDPQPSERLR